MANHHDRLIVEPSQSPDNGRVIGIGTITVKLHKIRENRVDVIQRIGPLGMARHHRDLPCIQLGVDILGQRIAFLLQAADFLRNIHRRIVLHIPQLFDLRFKFGDRLLEIEKGCFQRRLSSGRVRHCGDAGFYRKDRPDACRLAPRTRHSVGHGMCRADRQADGLMRWESFPTHPRPAWSQGVVPVTRSVGGEPCCTRTMNGPNTSPTRFMSTMLGVDTP